MKAPASLADLPRPLYFFDVYCVLCSGFVAFCLARDPDGRLRFTSAQSKLGQRVLSGLDLPKGTLDRTILLLDGDEVYTRSTAVLRGAIRWTQPLLLVPAVIRDLVYNLIARNRYRGFGRRPSCLGLTPEVRGRFIGL